MVLRSGQCFSGEQPQANTGPSCVRTMSKVAIVAAGMMVAGWTQSANAQAQQVSVAIASLQTALNSMGGAPAFSAIQDATVSGQTLDGNDQPTSPQITWESIGIAIRSAVTSQTGTSSYTAQKGIGYIENPSGSELPAKRLRSALERRDL